MLSPAAPEPHVLVAFNAPSLAEVRAARGRGRRRGLRQLGRRRAAGAAAGGEAVGVPFTQIAAELGKVIVKNIVALGALQEATRLFPKETFLAAIRQALSDKCALIPLNEEAFARGVQQAAQAGKGDA